MSVTKIIVSISFITISSNYIFTSILNSNNNHKFSSLYNELNDLKRQIKQINKKNN